MWSSLLPAVVSTAVSHTPTQQLTDPPEWQVSPLRGRSLPLTTRATDVAPQVGETTRKYPVVYRIAHRRPSWRGSPRPGAVAWYMVALRRSYTDRLSHSAVPWPLQ